jgi:hypothetical protein
MFTMNSEAFRKDLARAVEALPKRTQDALKHTAQYAALMARTSRLYKSHTFGLQKSITGALIGPGHSRASANAPYATYVENGTRAHFIFPVRAKALRFMQNGAVRFAAWVWHPGTKARPFMQEAAVKTEPLFERLVKEAADGMFA